MRSADLFGEQNKGALPPAAWDYRYPAAEDAGPAVAACEIPENIAEMCIRLAKTFGLSFALIELRLAEDGRWICFEAKPSPGYTFYEQRTGAPFTEALTHLLRRGHRRPRTNRFQQPRQG